MSDALIRGATRDTTTRIDRTLILDAAEVWPEAVTCPDWPRLSGTQRYDGPTGRGGAEQRLDVIGRYLNQGTGALRRPTDDERDAEMARVFRQGTNWRGAGFDGLRARLPSTEHDAELIQEACLIRGYLRKLDAIAEREAAGKKRAAESEARRTLEDYRATMPGYVEEVAGLAEAVARHRQRLADEQAFTRDRAVRDHAAALHSDAIRAAHRLGLGVPDAPEFL